MTELVQINKSQGVLELRLNRPDKKNALTHDMYFAMAEALVSAEDDPTVAVVLFSGEGGTFTAGNDLKDFQKKPPTDKESPVFRFIMALARASKPLIAAVDGVAVGIGTTMLLHCDMVYSSEDSQFVLPFVNLALLPEAGSSYLLPRMMGHAQAAELLLTGKPFSASKARELGFVNEVLPAPKLQDHAIAVAREIAKKPPLAVRLTKKLLKGDTQKLESVIHQEVVHFVEALASQECAEALAAFLEKRDPDFSKFATV